MEPTVTARLDGLAARQLLYIMALSREGDRREGLLHRQNKGWFQVSAMGHEALAAIAFAMRPSDLLFPYYRDRPLALARGVTNYELALAYLAKRDSSSGGRQMPGHYSDRERSIFSVATPTASQCLPAAGAAWGIKLDHKDDVVICTVGDASTRQGEFYEAVAFAVQENLPVIFVIEDNRYGISTPTKHMLPYRLGVLGDHIVNHIDGRDPYAVYSAAINAIARGRSGEGPSVLWCEIDRLASHTSSDDQRIYRTADELREDLQRDPIDGLARRLMREGQLDPAEWEAELAEIVEKVDSDYRKAAVAPEPDPRQVTLHIRSHGYQPPPTTPDLLPEECGTIVSAVNNLLHRHLEQNDHTVLFGEDIQDPKGGVFGLTRGLSDRFPDRVFNAPLSEATIVGSAVGLAATGWLPIIEVQFIDFICPAFNQLVTHISSLRWRTCGDWSCPLIMIAPYGAYLPGGSLWHSESNEGFWAHIHGLNIAIPSTPEDAAGLLQSAIDSNDPTLLLLPKHVFRKRIPTTSLRSVPFGKAATRRSGKDVTLVSWGNCLELCDEAARIATQNSIELEIIDLRTIAPCDYEAISSSVEKTGRLVVVHEDARTAGFGQTIIAEMTSHPERFNLFLSAPILVAREDTPVPYNPILEAAVLPSVQQILTAIKTVME